MPSKRSSAPAVTGRGHAGPTAGPAPRSGPLRVTSTVAQNGFGRLMERVAQDEVVVVTIRNAPRAVLLSSERYEALVAAEAAVLPTLTREFDELFARMQDPAVRAGTRRGFQADGVTMGKAAHAVAHRRGK